MRRASRRDGFAVMVVVVLIALLGAALAAAGAAFGAHVRLTRAATDDAQLRQLLIAGERAARQSLAGDTGAIALPPELTDRQAALRVERRGTTAEFRVEVELGALRRAQTLRYAREGDMWRLVEAVME